MTGHVQDFSNKRLSTAEWPLIREAYAETYPVRPLLNHIDRLEAALREYMKWRPAEEGSPLDLMARSALDTDCEGKT